MFEKMEETNICNDFYEAEQDDDWDDDNVAFIKYDTYEGDKMWIIYGADGSRIAATSNRDFAFIVARQNDLEPCSVH